MTKKHLIVALSGLALSAICIVAMTVAVLQSRHKCPYKECPYKASVTFPGGCGACEQGSDCWALDSLHFVHPSASYDQLDSILFSPQTINQ